MPSWSYRAALAVLLLILAAACAPRLAPPGPGLTPAHPAGEPRLSEERFLTDDGLVLPVRAWLPAREGEGHDVLMVDVLHTAAARIDAASAPGGRFADMPLVEASGRLAIGDAHLGDSNACPLERRDGVGIDRFSGGASRRAKFEMQVLTRGTLQTRIRLENFEDWQLGLLALLCRDLEDEQVSIGHATTRGLGRLRGTLSRFDVSYIVPPSRQLDHTRVHGVGSLLGDSSERGPYGYRDDDGFALDGAPPTLNTRGIRRVISLADDPRVLRGFLDSAVAHWARRMDEWRVS